MNKIEEDWARSILSICGPAPRCVLLREVGWDMRLATSILCDAVMLIGRILLDDRYTQAAAIIRLGMQHQGTFGQTIIGWMRTTGIKDASQFLGRLRFHTPDSLRRGLQKYRREHVLPCAKAAYEAPWWQHPTQVEYLRKRGNDLPAACNLTASGITLRAARPWAQLQILGSFKKEFGGGTPTCRLCRGAPETTTHLLIECTFTPRLIARTLRRHGLDPSISGADLLQLVAGAGSPDTLKAAAAIAKSLYDVCSCSQPLKPLARMRHASLSPSSSESSDDSCGFSAAPTSPSGRVYL
jgi:hypothetical protein